MLESPDWRGFPAIGAITKLTRVSETFRPKAKRLTLGKSPRLPNMFRERVYGLSCLWRKALQFISRYKAVRNNDGKLKHDV